MTIYQSIASDPAHSSWVSASARTGKTKVLTDRVLRLLLQGNMPGRILCLTYTKAAAAEMQNRLQATFARWVTADYEDLNNELTALFDKNEAVDEKTHVLARTLFAKVLDSSEGIRIQTIHALCQYILRRFPVEAGVDPHFTVLDERSSQDMLQEARLRLFNRERQRELPYLANAIAALSQRYSEQGIADIINQVIKHRVAFQDAFMRPSGVIRLNNSIYKTLGFDYGVSFSQLRDEIATRRDTMLPQWREAVEVLSGGSKTDLSKAKHISEFLSEDGSIEKPLFFLFLTAKNKPRKKLITKELCQKNPYIEEFLLKEQEWCFALVKRWLKLSTAHSSEHVVAIAESMLLLYQHMKNIRGALDYDDLIVLTRNVLNRPGIAPWVLHKLDGGIDHLLVDEAQDTSPEQWDIVQALTGDFFNGESARSDMGRTLFVVGDEKQSIYSFQGADPVAFQSMQRFFSRRIKEAGEGFQAINLLTSFRSTIPVLQAVDAVFAPDAVKDGVVFVEKEVRHEAHRNNHAGKVELWPLIELLQEDDIQDWPVAGSYQHTKTPSWRLAHHTVHTIHTWLKEKRLLPSKGRPVEPQDIMILVRRRNKFVDELIAAFKRYNVPVAGVDRLRLTDNIAVQDLISLANFLLLPGDDLSLAEVLKSPLFGLSEEELFELAYNRDDDVSLWQSLCAKCGSSNNLESAKENLSQLLSEVDYISPYELFSRQMEENEGRKKFAARLGEEINDPINEFMGQALIYEKAYPPSLQGFIHWLQRGDMDIKRDLEQPDNKVRVMTVHGTKGLQAPIVMLPDTTVVPRVDDKVVRAENKGEPYFIMLSYGEDEDEMSGSIKADLKIKQMQEYRRLLYVAMTRAEDELYVCGYNNDDKKNIPDECWYSLVKNGIEGITISEDFAGDEYHQGGTVLRLESEQQEKVIASETIRNEAIPEKLPEFAVTAAPEEAVLPRPLTPSKPEEAAVSDIMPATDASAVDRGKHIHTLLQYLPSLPVSERKNATRSFLQLRYPGEAPELLEKMEAEVFNVIEHPEFREVFSDNALAEVPVTGIVHDNKGNEYVISGQIDRLVVKEEEVLIIDYKTGQNIPSSKEAVPAGYISQMENYSQLVKNIYPKKAVKTALLWTSGPKLILLDS